MKEKIKTIIFMSILVLPSIVFFMIRITSPSTYSKLDFDLGEKREKAAIEEGLGEFYSDRVPFRSVLIKTYQFVDGYVEKPYNEIIMPGAMKLFHGEEEASVPTEDRSGAYENQSEANENRSGAYENQSDANENRFDANENQSDANEKQSGANENQSEAKESQPGTEEVQSKTEEAAIPGPEEKPAETEPAEGMKIFEEPEEGEEHLWTAGGVHEPDYDNYGYTEYVCSKCGAIKKGDFVEKLLDKSYLAMQVLGDDEGWTIIGRNNWLFLYGDGNIEYYRAENLLTQEEMAAGLRKMEDLQKICDEKGITLAFFFAPDKDQVYSEYMPSMRVNTDYKRLERFVDYVKDNSDLNVSYPLQELMYAKRFWQIYYRYDTHWNKMGGFIGTQVLYNSIGMPVTNPLCIDAQEVVRKEDGDLFALGGLNPAAYPEDTDYKINYRPEVKITYRSGKEYEILNVYKSKSTSENNQKLVLLGDSFRVKMLPFLEKDFSESVLIRRDMIDEITEDIKEADVLVIFAVERYENQIFETIDRITEILSE